MILEQNKRKRSVIAMVVLIFSTKSMVGASTEEEKHQSEQVLAHFVWIISFVTGWKARENRQTNTKPWLTLKLTLLSFLELNSKLICLKDHELLTSGCWAIKLFRESAPRTRYNNRSRQFSLYIIAWSRGTLPEKFNISATTGQRFMIF